MGPKGPPWAPMVPPHGILGFPPWDPRVPPWDPWVPPLGSLGTPPGIPGGEKNNLHFQPNFFLKKSPVAPLELIFCPSFFLGVRIPNLASELPFKPPREDLEPKMVEKNNLHFQSNFFF